MYKWELKNIFEIRKKIFEHFYSSSLKHFQQPINKHGYWYRQPIMREKINIKIR